MTEPRDERPWKVHLTCCGRDAGVESFATQPEAEAFRESYTSGPGVNEHAYSEAHKHLPGHQRSGVISHAEPAEPRDEPRARLLAAIRDLPRHKVKGSAPDHQHGYVTEVRELVELVRVEQALDAVLAAAPPEGEAAWRRMCPKCGDYSSDSPCPTCGSGSAAPPEGGEARRVLAAAPQPAALELVEGEYCHRPTSATRRTP